MKASFLTYGLAACLMVASGFVSLPAHASDERLGTSGKWEAFRSGKGKDSICFITSVPIKYEGKYDRNNRGDTRVFVTHHSNNPDERGIVSSIAGYRFKEGEPVQFTIDGKKKFSLFSVETRAWATKPEDDQALVKAMKRGRTLKVKGISSPGNTTIDTYSLSGFTKAMGMIDKACN
ncbi:MAG: invasion associated locus B family protein [Candidatus Puniceispirillales bacterium]